MFQSIVPAASAEDQIDQICSSILFQLGIVDDKLSKFKTISERERKLVIFCLEQGWITKKSIINIAAYLIHDAGVESFNQTQKISPKISPDHTSSHASLAWCIRNGHLDEAYIAKIPFDHGDTPETFIRFSEGLLKKVTRQILLLLKEK
jgi:hypothetical protein